VQLHRRDALLQPVHLVDSIGQVGVGQRPQRRVEALPRAVLEPSQHDQHTGTLEHQYDSFRQVIDENLDA
jgi:hypothetical protein